MVSLHESPASTRSSFIPVELDVPTLSQRAESIRRAARASVAAEVSAVEARVRAEIAAQRAARDAELEEARARASRTSRRTGLAVTFAALLAVATAAYVTQVTFSVSPIPDASTQAK